MIWRGSAIASVHLIAPFMGLCPPKAGLSPGLLALGRECPTHPLPPPRPPKAGGEEGGSCRDRLTRAKSPGLSPAFASLRRAKPRKRGYRRRESLHVSEVLRSVYAHRNAQTIAIVTSIHEKGRAHARTARPCERQSPDWLRPFLRSVRRVDATCRENEWHQPEADKPSSVGPQGRRLWVFLMTRRTR